jgi:DNA helicase-4
VDGAVGEWAGSGWKVTVTSSAAAVTTGAGTASFVAGEAAALGVVRSWFRWYLVEGGRRLVHLRGITKPQAQQLAAAMARIALVPEIAAATVWHAEVTRAVAAAVDGQRWLPAQTVDALVAARPESDLSDRVRAAAAGAALTIEESAAVAFADTDLVAHVASVNERIMAAELVDQRRFFDTIETSPLTDEQARAVICFDNRVQVLAAAGSGKTSVMVARAAYAVHRGFVPADRILMLAFNTAAAAELQERAEARFAATGIDSTGLKASTFHAFGLSLLGEATGEKPRTAAWLTGSDDLAMVMRIVDELRDGSETFRYQWDLFRMLFANTSTTLDDGDPDTHDKATDTTGFRTFGGEAVRSHGERLIANFLFLNGVDYRYEHPYEVNVADASHSQYRPDFYYPSVGVWHEHWALDRDGNPPPEFHRYAEGIAWKRKIHTEHRTKLVETTWADVMYGSGLEDLKWELTGLGLTFDWNPGRPIRDEWAKPLADEDLARLIRTFMTHVKSNSFDTAALEARLDGEAAGLSGYRTRLFLDLYWQIHRRWEQRLADEAVIDFEDMLVRAADLLDADAVECPYELVLADEFQDASRARARLVRGLVRRPGRYLLAVGDDWQAINRFAGADLSVMTGFEAWFGRGQQLALTMTFRCTQTICDVAASFVSKNPGQFNKPMRSVHLDPGPHVSVLRSDAPAVALAGHLQDLSEQVTAGAVGAGGSATVDVLGRYRFQRDVVPKHTPANLDVRFRTMHGSKGLEADFVVIPTITTGRYQFPSTISDDPVLGLAMPAPELYPHAEERRLFYVALTRARRQVTVISPTQRMSPFVIELLDDPGVEVSGEDTAPVQVCPVCKKGTMVQRSGLYGPFLGCTSYPACRNTRRL